MVWGTPESQRDGIASVEVHYPADVLADTLFEVGAYHPEFGTDYMELSLARLQ